MGDTSRPLHFLDSEQAALCRSELGQVGLALASLGGGVGWGGPKAPGIAREVAVAGGSFPSISL